MSYTVTWPVGTLSVGANNATGVANSLFVQDNMQADHYFNEGATKEGHHKFAKMTISGTLSAPDDPGVANVDATYYTRYNKTPTETDQTQNVQPFFETSWGQMQLLGIRAHGLVAVSSVTGVMTVHSSFNCTITRQGVWDASTNVGKFLCTFAPPCPNAHYHMYGGAIRKSTSTDMLNVAIESASSFSSSKSASMFKFNVMGNGNTLHDPFQFWFVVFGG